MDCPKCNAGLTPTNIRGTEVDKCSTCHGVWFDESELELILQLAPSDLRPIKGGSTSDEVNRQKATCPRDRAALVRLRTPLNSQIVLDSCPKCRGIWLDGGELDKLTL